ncbi:MAG: SdrD B-like domain-containing protein [Chitinophagales bacterium]
MKKSLLAVLVFIATLSHAQITNITPNQGTAGYDVSTTITSSGIFLTSSSPQGNIQEILLRKATDSVYANADSTVVVNTNTATTFFHLPANIGTGVYNLIVRIADLFTHAITEFSLSNVFTINSPSATVSGTVYYDLNSNGVKDSGEPGLSGYRVQLTGSGNYGISDATGAYSIAASAGSDVASIQLLADDTLETSGAVSYPITIVAGSNPGYNFGMKRSRYLISMTPTTGITGQVISASVTAMKAFKNGTIYNASLYMGSTVFPGFSFNVIDSNHASMFFNLAGSAPTGKYSLNILVKSAVNNQIRSYHLDTAITITGPKGLISGYYYIDSNHNNVYDAGDYPIRNTSVSCIGTGLFQSVLTDSNGYYEFHSLPIGAYTIGNNNVNCSGTNVYTPTSRSISVNEDSTKNQNFSKGNSGTYNLYIHPGWTSSNPGFDRQFWIYYGAYSGYSGNVTITMQYDSLMILDPSSIPLASHNISTHTITWVQAYNPWNYLIRPIFHIPVTLTSGTILHNVFHIGPDSLDCNISDNTVFDNTPVTSSMDPNEKIALPADTLEPKKDSIINYTINCQNTGTAPTHFVIIKDTLSPNLDYKTVQFTGSSHPCQFRNDNGILTFTMDPVALTDSATDEKNSHGSVSFSVKIKSGLPIGTKIKNKASIYFDFNPAVVTNETANTVAKKVSIGIAELNEPFDVNVFPNPFSESTTLSFTNYEHQKIDVQIVNSNGQIVRSLSTTNNEVVIYKNELPAGIYTYRLLNTSGKRSRQGKLIIL